MVVARLTNRSSQTVYLERCYPDWSYPIYGVETVGSDQDAAYDPAWGCVGHDHPIVVTAGETRTDSLQLTGPNMWDGHTHIPLGTLIGRFRLSYPLRMCPGEDDCSLSQVSVSSNDFEVRLAP
jgi:hypothetical protein